MLSGKAVRQSTLLHAAGIPLYGLYMMTVAHNVLPYRLLEFASTNRRIFFSKEVMLKKLEKI